MLDSLHPKNLRKKEHVKADKKNKIKNKCYFFRAKISIVVINGLYSQII